MMIGQLKYDSIMIIDLILDRRAGDEYDPRRFYAEVSDYGEIWPDLAYPIARAMDGGDEAEVKAALCDYIECNGYPEDIAEYVNSVKWL